MKTVITCSLLTILRSRSASILIALALVQGAQRSVRRQMVAIPAATQQKGKTLF